MKTEFKNMDEMLQKTLEGFEKNPSAGVWQRISRTLFIADWRFYIGMSVIVAGLVVLSLLLPKHEPSQKLIPQNNASATNSVNLPSNENKTEQLGTPSLYEEKVSETNTQSTVQSKRAEQLTEVIKSSVSSKKEKQDVSIFEEIDPLETNQTPEIQTMFPDSKNEIYPGLVKLNTSETGILLNPLFNSIHFMENQLYPFINPRTPDLHLPAIPEDDYAKMNYLWLSFHITPEAIFKRDAKQQVKKALDFDLTGIYRKQDWYVEAGAGIALSEDDGTFNINYTQNDSIGYFYKVTSFDIDPATGKPVFNTDVEGVYDTVPYNQTRVVNNRYTYLRFPVYGGIKVFDYKRFSVFLKTGAVFSVLTNKNESGINYINDKATWIQITNRTPERIHSTIQLSVGAGLMYKISNSLDLSIEPVYNYYLNSLYEQRFNSKSPWSAGLRTGINFKF